MITNISEVNMYYANIDTLKFCLPESPEKAGNKPAFRHTESRSIDITFLRSDGSPFDLTGIKLNLAMDNDYLHCTSLVAFADGDNVQIVDAAKGVARFYVDCNSRKFEQLVVFGSVSVKMEIVCIQSGEATERTILHDCGIRLFPRIRTLGDSWEPYRKQLEESGVLDQFFAANYLASNDPVFTAFLATVPAEVREKLEECEWDPE